MGFIEALKPFWHPVLISTELEDEPVKARLLNEQIVLYRTSQGVVALQDLCIHRGAALSLGKLQGDYIECPYHGFQYAPDGRCVLIPSLGPDHPIPEKARVVRYHAQERYGVIYVALEEPVTDIFGYPEYDDPGYRTTVWTRDFEAGATRVLENNYDYTHLAFIHAPILAVRSDDLTMPPLPPPKREGYEIVMDPLVVHEPNYAHTHQPVGPARVPIKYYSRTIMPLTSHTKTVRVDDGVEGSDAMVFVLVPSPISETESRTFVWLSRNYSLDWPDSEVDFIFQRILSQDIDTVQSQVPKRVPTDLRKELFLPHETHHVEYRRWLRELGVD